SHFDRRAARTMSLPLYLAVAFSVIGLLLTVKAAPIMLGLAASQSPAAVERASGEFYFWGLYLRGTVDVLAFAALVWALSNLRQPASRPDRGNAPVRAPSKRTRPKRPTTRCGSPLGWSNCRRSTSSLPYSITGSFPARSSV